LAAIMGRGGWDGEGKHKCGVFAPRTRVPRKSLTRIPAPRTCSYRQRGVVCLLITTVSPAKTDEPIEMSFGMWTREVKKPRIR